MTDKFHAIVALCPDATFGLQNNKVVWRDEKIKQPTDKEINDKIAELQADYDAKQYQRDRLQEYPDLQECIHAILDDDLTALQAKRKLVKDKYPKP
tara:strand:- start:10 stop:297 length:288 start_codon:yes stop_codon:yes gene_type:complete